MAGTFALTSDMRADNPNSFVRRVTLWALGAVFLLLPLAERVSAAPAANAQAASHFTIADFDGDNRPDVASVHVGQSGLQDTRYWIAFQLSSRSSQSLSVTAPTGGLRITARDVNGDNFPDVVITTLWTNKPVAILLNDGFGNFTTSKPSEFQSAFAAPETSWTFAAEEIRDASALLLARSVPGDCKEESRAVLPRRIMGLLLPLRYPISRFTSVTPFIGRAPPLL
jgi:hypothetical protein